MNVYIVSYDLRGKGKDYASLIAAIKSEGTWCNIHASVWAIATNATALQILHRLGKELDADDTIFVCRLAKGDGAWRGLTSDRSDWLKSLLSA